MAMTANGWLQIALFALVVLALTKPLGLYMYRVFEGERQPLPRLFGPFERVLYRLCGVDPKREQDWKGYTVAMLIFSFFGVVVSYGIMRLQHVLPLNPQKLGPVAPDLAFNTAVSFTTNTNWQNYGGESTMSYLSQMSALAWHNFASAAVGIGIALALARGLTRRPGPGGPKTLGSFWVDLVRAIVYVLLPISVVVALVLVASGLPQTLSAYRELTTLEGVKQVVALGPVASQEVIKELGTNGGGFFNANSAHPFENPAPAGLAVERGLGNMEGKEVRFGVANSALWATVTTDTSCGAVNSMHDSFTPLGGLVPLVNIQLGEVVFGGVGAGLYGMLIFVLLSVFIAGLMVGRTPEYLGKKIEAREMKLAMLYILIFPLLILGLTAWAAVAPYGTSSLNNAGPHGLSEMMYAYASQAGNNGSAFAGLSGNTKFWNVTGGLDMLVGRFLMIVPALAIAGAMIGKKVVPAGPGTFPTTGATFTVLLVAVILIVGALTFLPALSLGPVLEHFSGLAGKVF